MAKEKLPDTLQVLPLGGPRPRGKNNSPVLFPEKPKKHSALYLQFSFLSQQWKAALTLTGPEGLAEPPLHGPHAGIQLITSGSCSCFLWKYAATVWGVWAHAGSSALFQIRKPHFMTSLCVDLSRNSVAKFASPFSQIVLGNLALELPIPRQRVSLTIQSPN